MGVLNSVLGFLLLWLSLPAQSQENQAQAGTYENLMLAIDAENNLTGYYREEQGAGPGKQCIFFLQGKIKNNQAEVRTWQEKVFKGVLRFGKDAIQLTVPQGREHPGCGLVLLPQIATGLDFGLTQRAPYTQIKIVASPRAVIFQKPAENAATKSFYIRKDVLGVVAQTGEWLEIAYTPKNQNPRAGWIRLSDTQALLPPKP